MNKILIGTMHIYSMPTLISCSSNVAVILSILGLGVRGSAKCHETSMVSFCLYNFMVKGHRFNLLPWMRMCEQELCDQGWCPFIYI